MKLEWTRDNDDKIPIPTWSAYGADGRTWVITNHKENFQVSFKNKGDTQSSSLISETEYKQWNIGELVRMTMDGKAPFYMFGNILDATMAADNIEERLIAKDQIRVLGDTLTIVPAMKNRPETGPMMFGDDDWPGVFIRGAFMVRGVIEQLQRDSDLNYITESVLKGLAETLESCRVIHEVAPEDA